MEGYEGAYLEGGFSAQELTVRARDRRSGSNEQSGVLSSNARDPGPITSYECASWNQECGSVPKKPLEVQATRQAGSDTGRRAVSGGQV
ncbi:hypothetical protein MRX96_009501 [Rhipicephalus microplus]